MEGKFYIRNCKSCNSYHSTPCKRARVCEICKAKHREEMSIRMQRERLFNVPIAN